MFRSARSLQRIPIMVTVCLLMAAGVAVTGGVNAVAAPTPTIDEVRRQVRDLREQAEVATERYNAAKEDIASLAVRLTAARTRLAEQQVALGQARRELGRVAADTYKAGDLATLSLFLSDDPDGYVGTDQLLTSLGDQRARAISDLLGQRQALVASMTDVEEQRQRLERRERELRQSQADVERKLGEADRLLGRLTAEQRVQLAAGENASYRNELAGQGVTVPASGRLTCKDIPLGHFEARVTKVIDYACSKIGDPYRWGAAGPARFDCSGLTLMAWKQAGVSLPHNAAMQATHGTTVSIDDLRPGDLVFFYRPIGHNGIYIGNGLMIHAPQTGDSVKIVPMRYMGAFTTAVRL